MFQALIGPIADLAGSFMQGQIEKQKAKAKHKKYTAIVRNKITKKERKINFGDNRYENFKDSTPLKLYSSKNHGDKKRRKNYSRKK